MTQQTLVHPIPPTWNENSQILILGSWPSVKSRARAYFYGHPQNRFWQLLALLFEEPLPETKSERESLLLRRGIAVWDVIASCSISGSADSSIRDVVVNDLSVILEHAPIQQIYVNGRKAESLYCRDIQPQIHRDAICRPSTSPANAAWTLEKLLPVWQQILTFL